MFNIVSENLNFDFVGKRSIWVGLSIVMILATFAMFFTKGLNYGIDFTGGAEVKVRIPQDWDTAKIRTVLEKGGLQGMKILQIGSASESEYMIRVQQLADSDLNQNVQLIQKTLSNELQPGQFEVKSADIVGPSAGGLLRKNGALAMFYALLAILMYVAIRFDFRFAPGAVLALFHDVVIVLGVFMLTGKEFDLTVLAAILALVGYSNNDTIIVYDRVRETMKANPSQSIEATVNQSINQTLGRTLMTSFSTFISVAALWIFGGHVLEPFAFALMVGIVVGTYSSIFIASSMVIILTNRKIEQTKTGKGRKRREVKLSPEANVGI